MKHAPVVALWVAAIAWGSLPGCGKREVGPDQALQQVAQGLAKNKPEVVWEALPETYQEDVTGMVHEFGRKMDPEIWAKACQVARKACGVLKAKKEFLWANPMLAAAAGRQTESMRAAWGPALECALTLLNSELSDVGKLKALDLRAFLAGTGAKFMQQVSTVSATVPGDPFNTKTRELADATLTVLKLEEDDATVRVQTPGGKPRNVSMIRVEGKWVIQEVVERWQDAMAKAKDALAAVSPEAMAGRKPSVLKQMAEAEKLIDALGAAQTPQEFNALIVPLVLKAMGAMGGGHTGQ